MPQTINGIGTSYYGSKNRHTRDDTCEHCGTFATLSSYDTTKSFVILFIPLVPLGRFRVVDQCASCRQHYAIPLKEWEEQRDEEIAVASKALEGDPWNVEYSRALVQACVSYHYREGFDRSERIIVQALSSDAPGLAFLGSAYEYFADFEKAQDAYRRSLALQDDPGVRETLGVLLLKHQSPDEAKEFLRHLTLPAAPDNDPLLYYLVEAFQAQARHADADEVLSAMARKNPERENDAVFQKYRKRVRKRLGSMRPLASPLVKGKPLGYDGSRRLWIATAVGAVLLGGVGFFLFQKTQRVDVYLLNGLDKPYRVSIDGATHTLQPFDVLELSVPRRNDVITEAVEAELGWASVVEIEAPTGFWLSLWDSNTYLVNPDHTAVIVWEQAEYREKPVQKEMPSRLHLGRGFHLFANLDYVFEDFPEEITLDSGRSVETRDRIWWPPRPDPMDVYSAAIDMGAEKGFSDYLAARLRGHPDDENALRLAAALLSDADFTSLAEPRLAARPLAMEWHRMYQSRLETLGESEALLERYREMLAADPGNSDLMYLCARVTPDAAAAEKLLLEGISSERPSAYAFHGLSFQRLVEARFEEAMELSQRARELDPDRADFSYGEEEALLALGRFGVLLERNAALRQQDPITGEYVAQAVRLYVALDDQKSARELIDTYMHSLYETEDDTASWKNYLESVYHLGSGEWNSYIERASAIEQPRFQFQSELARGYHRAAMDALTEASEDVATDYLLAYLSARRGNDRENAEEYLKAAIDKLSQQSMEERLLARCLQGEVPRSTMFKLSVDPQTKTIGLAVLAERTGDAGLRRLAKQLNYHLSFERYYLDAAVF